MGLDDLLEPGPGWMKQLHTRVGDRGLSLERCHAAVNSHYFKIEGYGTCAVGKTHHSRKTKRNESYINLNSVEEATWKENPKNIPFSTDEDIEIVDIFGIVIDHRSSDFYQADKDNFLVLTEDILEEIPESGKKQFRITSEGYRHPFGKYENSWERIFKNLSGSRMK